MQHTNGDADVYDIAITSMIQTMSRAAKSRPAISLCAVYGRVAIAVFCMPISGTGHSKNSNAASPTERANVGNIHLDSRLNLARLTESFVVDYATPRRAPAELESHK
jgi:hypothetical protein